MTIKNKYYTIMSNENLMFLDDRCYETDSVENAIFFEELEDAKEFVKTLDEPEDFHVAEIEIICNVKRV